jgi:hypothetical protein
MLPQEQFETMLRNTKENGKKKLDQILNIDFLDKFECNG